MKNRLQPMGPGAILDNTFFILRDRFWKFQGVIFLSYLPAIVIGLLILIPLIPALISTGNIFALPEMGEEALSELASSVGILGVYIGILSFALLVAMIIGTIHMTGGAIKLFATGLQGEECGVREALAVVKGKRWRFIGVGLSLFLLGFAIQLLLLFISDNIPDTGQIWVTLLSNVIVVTLGFLFSLTNVVLFLEDKKVFATLRRAFTLMARHRWRVAGTYLLVGLMAYAIMVVIYLLAIVPVVIFVALGVHFKLVAFYVIAGVLGLASILLFNIFIVYMHGPLTCIYYDLLIRKEGYDLSRRMAGQTPASPAPGIPGPADPGTDSSRGLDS